MLRVRIFQPSFITFVRNTLVLFLLLFCSSVCSFRRDYRLSAIFYNLWTGDIGIAIFFILSFRVSLLNGLKMGSSWWVFLNMYCSLYLTEWETQLLPLFHIQSGNSGSHCTDSVNKVNSFVLTDNSSCIKKIECMRAFQNIIIRR